MAILDLLLKIIFYRKGGICSRIIDLMYSTNFHFLLLDTKINEFLKISATF